MPSITWIRLIFAVLAVLGLAGALTLALLPLPAPAAGGTCGPGTSSEPALFALFAPGSIGAGPEPSATNSNARAIWHSFVSECQSATDGRMAAALVLVVVAAILGFVAPPLAGRLAVTQPSPGTPPTPPPPGWYPDPAAPGRWRWWDGTSWGRPRPPAGQPPDT